MKQAKFATLLLVFYFLSANLPAVEINECEDKEGNRSFEQTCPPGTTLVNKKHYKTPGSETAPAQSENTPSPVVLYLKPECSICDRVRNFLDANNVPVIEKNVNDGEEIRDELTTKTGINAAVPVLFIGDQMIRGFDNLKMASLLKDAGYQVVAPQAP